MALPTISPPEHYSADAAYRLLRPLRPALESAQSALVTGIDAQTAVRHFSAIGTLAANLNEALTAGSIAGSPEWTATAQAALAELSPVLATAAQVEKVYAKRVGVKIATEADLGNVLSLSDAQAATLLDQADVDTMRELVDGLLV